MQWGIFEAVGVYTDRGGLFKYITMSCVHTYLSCIGSSPLEHLQLHGGSIKYLCVCVCVCVCAPVHHRVVPHTVELLTAAFPYCSDWRALCQNIHTCTSPLLVAMGHRPHPPELGDCSVDLLLACEEEKSITTSLLSVYGQHCLHGTSHIVGHRSGEGRGGRL